MRGAPIELRTCFGQLVHREVVEHDMAAVREDLAPPAPRSFLATPTRQRTVSTSTVLNDATPLLAGSARPLPSRPTARLIFAACIAAAGSSFQFGYHVGDYGAAAIGMLV